MARSYKISKFLCSVFCLLLLNTGLLAQQNKLNNAKNSFVFGSGIGMPFSNYGNANITNQNAGLAENGLLFELSYKRIIEEKFGLSLLYRTQFNKIDKDKIKASFKAIGASEIHKVSLSSWELNSLMIGLFSHYPLDQNNKLSLLLHFHAGISMVTLPDIEVVYETNPNTYASIKNNHLSENSKSFSFMLGSGLQYRVSQKIAFSFNADLFYSKPNFEYLPPSGNNQSPDNPFIGDSYAQSISIASIKAGVVVLF